MIDFVFFMIFLFIISLRFFIYPRNHLEREIFYIALFIYFNGLFYLSLCSFVSRTCGFIFFHSIIAQTVFILAPLFVVLHTAIFQVEQTVIDKPLFVSLIVSAYMAVIISMLYLLEHFFSTILRRLGKHN